MPDGRDVSGIECAYDALPVSNDQMFIINDRDNVRNSGGDRTHDDMLALSPKLFLTLCLTAGMCQE